MTLPKKGLRKITVDGFHYAWSAKGNDGGISLTVAPLYNEGQILTTEFDYHSKVVDGGILEDGSKWRTSIQQLIVTPYIVRQVIEYALKNGWNPLEKGPQLNIYPIEDKIDLRIEEK